MERNQILYLPSGSRKFPLLNGPESSFQYVPEPIFSAGIEPSNFPVRSVNEGLSIGAMDLLGMSGQSTLPCGESIGRRLTKAAGGSVRYYRPGSTMKSFYEAVVRRFHIPYSADLEKSNKRWQRQLHAHALIQRAAYLTLAICGWGAKRPLRFSSHS